jgi:serine/threonine-protein kinase
VLSAAAFVQQTQSAQSTLAESAQALGALPKNPRLSPAALEALTTELGATTPGNGNAPRIVVADSDAASAITLQVRLMAEGLSVHRTRTRAETEKALSAGAQAIILATALEDGETHDFVQALKKAAATAPLPLFLLAPTDDSAVVTAGLEAGAEDVLVRPFNVEVLTAKLRRALAQRQRAGRG